MCKSVLEQIKGGLIVSCQALKEEPLYSSYIMSRMAYAAMLGGAVGIRANTVVDIEEIKKTVDLPIIGIIKEVYGGCDVYITPTIRRLMPLPPAGWRLLPQTQPAGSARTAGRWKNFSVRRGRNIPTSCLWLTVQIMRRGSVRQKSALI